MRRFFVLSNLHQLPRSHLKWHERVWKCSKIVVKAKALPLVSLVYSGNKSIHGVIRVDAPDLPTCNHYRAKILSLYGADPDPRYRLDPQALHPLTGTRLAGVIRKSTGKAQELLWLR